MSKGLTWEDVVSIGLGFPEVTEGTTHGHPCLRVGKKFVTRLNDEREPSIVVMLGSVDEQQHLLELDPVRYHITPHYNGYPAALMRLAEIGRADVAAYIERRFRAVATKRAIKALEEQQGG